MDDHNSEVPGHNMCIVFQTHTVIQHFTVAILRKFLVLLSLFQPALYYLVGNSTSGAIDFLDIT